MAFRALSTNLISSVWEFRCCTSLLHVFCRCWTPSRLGKIANCCVIWCPSSINARLNTVCSTRCYRSISSHCYGTERTFWTFNTEWFWDSCTDRRFIINGTSSILVIPIIVISIGAFDIVSACFIFAICAWRTTIAVSHADISPPAIWAGNWHGILFRAVIASRTDRAVTWRFIRSCWCCVITWLAHLHSREFSSWAFVTGRAVHACISGLVDDKTFCAFDQSSSTIYVVTCRACFACTTSCNCKRPWGACRSCSCDCAVFTNWAYSAKSFPSLTICCSSRRTRKWRVIVSWAKVSNRALLAKHVTCQWVESSSASCRCTSRISVCQAFIARRASVTKSWRGWGVLGF